MICSFISCKDEVTISYVPLVVGEPQRTEHIQNEWCFICDCPR